MLVLLPRHRIAGSRPRRGSRPAVIPGGTRLSAGPLIAARPGRAAITAALVVVVQSLGYSASAAADTARIVPDDATRTSGPMSAAIVITAHTGAARTLGPYRFRHVPTDLTSSPDGRYLVVGFGMVDQTREIVVVPTDGSGLFTLRTRPRSLVATSVSDVSWTADGNHLIVGNVEDHRSPRGRWRYHSAALRCSIATRSCQRIPDSEGLAAAVPGGIVTSTPLDDVLPSGSQLGGDVEPTTIDARPSRQSRYERGLLREVRKSEQTRTTFVSTVPDRPPTTRTLAERRAPLTAGVDATISVLGGPSGALIVHDRHRVAITRRGKKLRLRSQTQARRWTVIAPDGTRRTRPMREFLVPRADAPTHEWGEKLPRQRLGTVPSVAIPTGGWLGTVGAVRGLGPGGYVLTRISPTGVAAFMRTRGQLASARTLVRTIFARTPTPGTASLDVVGYEAATDAAIVTLDWTEGSESITFDRLPDGTIDPEGAAESNADTTTAHRATVRVPLDGRTGPTVVNREQEHAAW